MKFFEIYFVKFKRAIFIVLLNLIIGGYSLLEYNSNIFLVVEKLGTQELHVNGTGQLSCRSNRPWFMCVWEGPKGKQFLLRSYSIYRKSWLSEFQFSKILLSKYSILISIQYN